MCQVFIYDYCCYRFILTQRIMKANLTNYLNSYLRNISGDKADIMINIGLARIAYVSWVSENNFILHEGDHLDPNLEHFPEMLEAFDVLVFDIQDVGARFYTYLYSLSYAMESCAKADILASKNRLIISYY